MRDERRAAELTEQLEGAIVRSVRALDEACDVALNAPIGAGECDDAVWLCTEMDRWVRMPAKIRDASQLGTLEVAVYWDQRFEISVHPRHHRATLADVVFYYRRCSLVESFHPLLSSRLRMLVPERVSHEARCAEQIDLFRRFARTMRCVEQDGALYVDLADLLRDALCHWTGHWVFDGIVLDRYVGDEIDYGFYFREYFREPSVAARFERFRDEMYTARLNRETTWKLFSPSGQRVWKVVAVLAMDGNTDAFLLESEGEFLDIYASGS